VRVLPLLPGLARAAMPVALGVLLLLAGCASTGIQTAVDTKGWERCDRSNLTFLCFQR